MDVLEMISIEKLVFNHMDTSVKFSFRLGDGPWTLVTYPITATMMIVEGYKDTPSNLPIFHFQKFNELLNPDDKAFLFIFPDLLLSLTEKSPDFLGKIYENPLVSLYKLHQLNRWVILTMKLFNIIAF